MILPFSTKINGKETYFVEKILKNWEDKTFDLEPVLKNHKEIFIKAIENHYLNIDKYEVVKPKLHTLRDDINDRWNEGIMIDYFINVRKKNMFRFAPRVPVVSTQEVFMTHYYSDIIQITIDDTELVSYTERLEFAINDGFDNWEDFFNYFYPKIKAAENECCKPKLIHWTDLRY